MGKEEAPPAGGLLSKVVRFVRNPTVNWSDLDQADSGRDSAYSRQMLKEMIERKRRNDFVRRREFDHLRKLRSRGALTPPGDHDGEGVRPSFFHSSLPSRPGDRAVTLKKINEIEAQMSMQWWRTRQPAAAAEHGAVQTPSSPAAPSAPAGLSTAALADIGGYASTMAATLQPQEADSGLLFPVHDSAASPGRGAAGHAPRPGVRAAAPVAEPFVHDPEFEDAAIFFANGDYRGAEASLVGIRDLRTCDAGRIEAWKVLFDLYRAAGWYEPFDNAAIDYAVRFGQSAPLWFSLPELSGEAAAPDRTPSAAAAGAWHARSLVTAASLAELQRGVAPALLDWDAVQDIARDALAPLAALMARWADSGGDIVFHGAGHLGDLLRARTPSGERGVEPAWWRLRLGLLRLQAQADEFELVALDYCVTYEVSPPAWQPPACRFRAAGDAVPLDGLGLAIDLLGAPPASASVPPAAEAVPGLAGHLVGDAASRLLALDEVLEHTGRAVDCGRLARVDFTAAGSILNWAAAHEAEGHRVQFLQVQRLVAVFFNVIGINEHALIVPRTD